MIRKEIAIEKTKPKKNINTIGNPKSGSELSNKSKSVCSILVALIWKG
jgi:hypothetical protein